MQFECTSQQMADRVVVTVAGDVDLAAYPDFQASLAGAWDGTSDLVIDLSGVAFLDSMGLRVLVQARKQALDNGRHIALAAPSDPVLKILELAGVTAAFSLLDDPLQEVGTAPEPT